MKLGIVSDLHRGDPRIAMMPATVARYVKCGVEIRVEKGFGRHLGIGDDVFVEAGAEIGEREDILAHSAAVARVRAPSAEDIELMGEGTVHITLLDPFREEETVELLRARGISAVSMEMIPRSTYAQKMDALSSQANLAGYAAVILGAGRIRRIMPMMTTPSGTIRPLDVFVIGAGVAGLQAIATARRLGARVSAYDIRPAAQEQITSLGAKSVSIDIGEMAEGKDGYAKQLSEEQLAKQRQGIATACSRSHMIITTAKVFGKEAPTIITAEMIAQMQPGTIVVDMAVETGGNVAGSCLNEAVELDGVTILGYANLEGRVPWDASDMYAINVFHMFSELWDSEAKALVLDRENEITAACLLTHGQEIVSTRLKTS